MHLIPTICCSLAAAVRFALSAVLQQRSARAEPQRLLARSARPFRRAGLLAAGSGVASVTGGRAGARRA